MMNQKRRLCGKLTVALCLMGLAVNVSADPVALEAYATPAWGIGPFIRPTGDVNPVIKPSDVTFDCPMRGKPVAWEKTHTFNPAAAVKDGKVYLLYRAEDDSGTGIATFTSRLGLAVSEDGMHFTKRKAPVLYPDNDAQKVNEWTGGCEDPRLVEGPDGTYVLTYTQYGGKGVHLGIATTKDFEHWDKHGPAFGADHSNRYKGLNEKSGAIVVSMQDGRLKAAKINGKYWMYWGEGFVALASSDNLLDWEIVEEQKGKPLAVLAPRPGLFDSNLAEGGPNAILTDKGILVVYNGKNEGGTKGDQSLGEGAYADGQALFDAKNPAHLLQRTENPFYRPAADFEMTGQYKQGTTFSEGLIFFQGKWMMYYGCADSYVAMAVCDPTKEGATALAKSEAAK